MRTKCLKVSMKIHKRLMRLTFNKGTKVNEASRRMHPQKMECYCYSIVIFIFYLLFYFIILFFVIDDCMGLTWREIETWN